MSPNSSVLRVFWETPVSLDSSSPILSFLAPLEEEKLSQNPGLNVLSAAEESRLIRENARRLYLDMVAGIGIAPMGDGRTFRQALINSSGVSRWWFHWTSFKDPESDPAFGWIIAVLTIQSVAAKLNAEKVIFYKAPQEVVGVFRGCFELVEHSTQKSKSEFRVVLRAVASRISYAFKTVIQSIVIRWLIPSPRGTFESAFFGFWDYSVYWDEHLGRLVDPYFKQFPQELQKAGVRSMIWLAWLELMPTPQKFRRYWWEAVPPLKKAKGVAVLQGLLGWRDVVKAVFDFKPFAVFVGLRRKEYFKKIFRRDSLDFYPLFREKLLYNFLDFNIAHCELMGVATERAVRLYCPRMVFSFQEHFTHSRAQYHAVRRAGLGTVIYIMQHASFNHEKTMLFLHPVIEFRGEPDGCAVPCPDYVFAMGTLGQQLFLECGYPSSRVFLTGSARYDYVRVLENQAVAFRDEKYRILIICSRDVEIKLDFIQAVYLAVRDMSNVEIHLRKFPSSSIENNSEFSQYRDRVSVTKGSLAQDLAMADLVLFTCSTIAEEAFLMGKPVWQWTYWDFINGSAITEVASIPQFSSAGGLRKALLNFVQNPDAHAHSLQYRREMVEKLFYRDDGGAAGRMALVCVLPGRTAIVSEIHRI